MKHNDVILHLSLIDGIGPATVKKIIQCKPSTMPWADLYGQTHTDLHHLFNCSQKVTHTLYNGLQSKTLVQKELELIAKHSINVVSILDEDYPTMLQNIHVPPTVLYWQGVHPNTFKKNIAIVGARKADSYGKKVIDRFVPALIKNDWTIVSGGALGADSFAHRATIERQGNTMVVLGSGLLHWYPKGNSVLFKDVLQAQGTMVSSFPLQTEPSSENFPMRNRIISGLSRGCIVVQAAKRSGASITARYALEQGREVFAVPGAIDNYLSVGCNTLIQAGAKLVHTIDDVLIEFGEKSSVLTAKQKRSKPVQKQSNFIQPINNQKKNNLSAVEKQIFEFCKNAASTDDVSHLMNKSLPEIQAILFDMQIQGLIKQDFTGKWVTC